MHIICMTYAGRMPAPQLFSIFGLYDLAAHQLKRCLGTSNTCKSCTFKYKQGMPINKVKNITLIIVFIQSSKRGMRAIRQGLKVPDGYEVSSDPLLD
jgi:hypothetical protein